jgi:hypothetical protein
MYDPTMSAGRNDMSGLLPNGYLISISGFNIATQLLIVALKCRVIS